MTLYLGFVLLSALLLWAVIYARGPWAIKLVLIVSVPAYAVVVLHSIEQWKGYPAAVSPPQGAALVAQLVDEPRSIYLWLIPPGAERPRAYRIPYTRETHEQAAKAQSLLQTGHRVGFRRSRGRYEAYDLPTPLPQKEAP